MNISKNPIFRRRTEIEQLRILIDANGEIIARLTYALGVEFPKEFYPKKQKEFIDCYKDSVEYVDSDADSDIRSYKFKTLEKDAPYINKERAGGILTLLELSANPGLKEAFTNTTYREALIENVYLMLHTLHQDFRLSEKRITRIITAWTSCDLENPLEWLEELVQEDIHTGYKKLALEVLDKRKYKMQPPTVREQMDAEKYMDDFKRTFMAAEGR